MDSISVNQFRENLNKYVDQTISKHQPLKVTSQAGESFIVLSAEYWESQQETLHVLQNNSLMQQIAESMKTHNNS
jgi:antitoxin YefM